MTGIVTLVFRTFSVVVGVRSLGDRDRMIGEVGEDEEARVKKDTKRKTSAKNKIKKSKGNKKGKK